MNKAEIALRIKPECWNVLPERHFLVLWYRARGCSLRETGELLDRRNPYSTELMRQNEHQALRRIAAMKVDRHSDVSTDTPEGMYAHGRWRG